MTQPMTSAEVIDFLSATVAYDNRNPGQANIAAWTEAAARGRWTLDEALDALHEHYAASTEFLMPGHITARVRQARRDAHEREVAARLAAPSALPAAGYRLSPALQAVHDEANRRDCPLCRRPAGERCTEPGSSVRTRIPHLARMTGRVNAAITRKVPA